MAKLRLDKALADQGIATRSSLRDLIRGGRVSVNGVTERSPERRVDPVLDQIKLDGREVSSLRFHTYMMDKPCGILTATKDGKQKTVLDLLPPELRRMGVFPVGRLDKDTSGLLLLTNDGDFAHRVISPKSAVEKRYYARVEGELDQADAEAFREGLVLRDGTRCLPAKLELLGEGRCLVTVMEGKYHQVRRMLASRGAPVLELRRLSVGGLTLDEKLGPGGWRELTEMDLCSLFSQSCMGNLSKNQ